MYAFIEFIMGPMFWISLAVCFAGIVFRVVLLARTANEKDKFIFTYFSFKYGMRSILAWLVPFYPKSTRTSPLFYLVSYIFHALIFIVPIFLLSHVVLLEESFGWEWITLKDSVADILTILVIAALVFFGVRRVVAKEVKFLTNIWDYFYLLLVALPFVTGFIAYHQIFAYKWMLLAHVLSGEFLLMIIPFTRFFHMVLAPISRAYTGSEFGGVRKARDW